MPTQVTVDPHKAPRLPADVPPTPELMASLRFYLDLSGRDQIAKEMLGAHVDNLPAIALPLQRAMLKRAAVVLRKKKAVVEQWFREMPVELMDKIEEVHKHSAIAIADRVDRAFARLAACQAMPADIEAVLAAAGSSQFHAAISHPTPDRTEIVITGDCSREVASVLCSGKAAGLGATRIADRFVVNFSSFNSSVDGFAPNLARALRAIAEIRQTGSPTLLAAFETADRARAERKLEFVELQAGKGRAYTKYLAELNGLGIDRFPDLRTRLDKALALITKPPGERDAERWVSFVEAAAAKGYMYEKGVEEIARMDLSTWPELHTRYVAAIGLANQATALKWVSYVEDSAQKGFLYVKGVEALGLMDLYPFPDMKERLDAAVARAARSEAEQASDGKTLVPASAPPATGELWEIPGGDSVVFVQRLGAAYPITDRSAKSQGPHLVDHIGQLGRLAYWRHATPAELESFFGSPPAPIERDRG